MSITHWIAYTDEAIAAVGTSPEGAVDRAIEEVIGYALGGTGTAEERADQIVEMVPREMFLAVAREGGWMGAEDWTVEGNLGYHVSRATPALVAQVEEEGGAIAWGALPDGTACTVLEEDIEEETAEIWMWERSVITD